MPLSDNTKTVSGDFLLAPETVLQNRYRIVRRLGKGGMGVVYEAVDMRLDTTVALKQTLTVDKEHWQQFEREARLMAGLNHPALPRVNDYFNESDRAFFVMQFVDGSDLSRIIAQQPGPFPRQQVIAWADQLLDALIYLHSRDRQIIHRDIKPHNLKITSTGRIALLDFGLAKTHLVGSSTVSCTSVFGYTPRYAPLEQIQDLGTGPKSDIYALGATLYHLLTGIKPPDAVTRAAALVSASPNPLRPANEINGAVGPELSAILERAMAQNPAERYQSAIEFREAIRRLGRTGTSSHELLQVEIDIGDATVVPRRRPTRSLIEIAAAESEGGRFGEILGLSKRAQTGSNIKAVPGTPSSSLVNRFSLRVGAAVFVILIAAFGVFCRYYPWKLPPATESLPATVMTAEAATQLQRSLAEKDGFRHKPRNNIQIVRQ